VIAGRPASDGDRRRAVPEGCADGRGRCTNGGWPGGSVTARTLDQMAAAVRNRLRVAGFLGLFDEYPDQQVSRLDAQDGLPGSRDAPCREATG
jgi:hypothetical protein